MLGSFAKLPIDYLTNRLLIVLQVKLAAANHKLRSSGRWGQGTAVLPLRKLERWLHHALLVFRHYRNDISVLIENAHWVWTCYLQRRWNAIRANNYYRSIIYRLRQISDKLFTLPRKRNATVSKRDTLPPSYIFSSPDCSAVLSLISIRPIPHLYYPIHPLSCACVCLLVSQRSQQPRRPMFFQLSVLHLLLSIFQIRPTLAFTTATRHVSCYNTADPVNAGDCIVLTPQLVAKNWFSHAVVWGESQPLPGKTPVAESFGTCEFEMYAVNARVAESLRLSDYLYEIRSVVSQCLQPGSIWNGGHFLVGRNNNFVVYIGGKLKGLSGGLNGTNVVENVGQV